MKSLLTLFAGLGFAAVAVAASVLPAVDTGSSVEPEVTTLMERETNVDKNVNLTSLTTDFGFYPFAFLFTEYCDGHQEKSKGRVIFIREQSAREIDLSSPTAFHAVNTPYGDIEVRSDSVNSNVNFAYKSCVWRQNYKPPNQCAFCSGQWEPNLDSKPDCNSDKAKFRSRRMYSTCAFAIPESKVLPAAAAEDFQEVSAPKVLSNVVSRQDFPVIKVPEDVPEVASAISVAGSTYVGYSLKVIEYCVGNARNMKVQWMNAKDHAETEYMDVSDPGTIYFVQTQHGKVQIRWDDPSSMVKFRFNSCDWPMNYSDTKACGWCMPLDWKPNVQQPDCNSPNPNSRTFSAGCVFNSYGSLPARDDNIKPDTNTKELSFINATTENIQEPNDIPINLPLPATPLSDPVKIVIERPKIILKPALSVDGYPVDLIILPFHVKITDHCVNGQRQITSTWTNGDRVVQDMTLEPGRIWAVNHKIPGYSNLTMGSYDWAANRLRFEYMDCVWYDEETWRQCGECRAALWTAPPPDCAAAGRGFRTKDMDCSNILGIHIDGNDAMALGSVSVETV